MSKYVFKPYSSIFPELFNKEKSRITPHLNKALAIEHIGSTSICNLGGKGIIDIAIAVNKEDMDATSNQLQHLGYEFRPAFSTPDRFYFIIHLPDPEEGNRRYHVHLTYPESSDWKGFISFRDYLRAHPEEVQEYAEMKKQAACEANQEGSLYRKIKEPIFQKINCLIALEEQRKKLSFITFERASLNFSNHVLQWLEEPHVKEFWDNSPEHREDILIFMNGRKEPSPYWGGMFDYWIGFVNAEPYCLLMTSEILPTQSDLSEVWKSHLSKEGRTFSIDFMIGNKKYLGHGLGGPTLEAFTQFVQENVDRSIDTFFIDPADSNPRARHVYEKGGFKTVATFFRDFGKEKNVKHFLMVKNMIPLDLD